MPSLINSPSAWVAGLLLLSLAMAWLPRYPYFWAVPLAAGIIFGLQTGSMGGAAILPIAVLAAACIVADRAHNQGRRTASMVGAGIVILIAVGLGLHVFPGFARIEAIAPVVLSPLSTPYAANVNTDKLIAGILILVLAVRRAGSPGEWRSVYRLGTPVAGVTILVVVALALLTGFVTVDVKWTALFWTWLGLNLVTCITEEALFRGFLLPRLITALGGTSMRIYLAVGISALLFGIAHFSGGWTYVLLSAVAGIGYGVAYVRAGHIEAAILTHLALNTFHFLFLTYPMAIQAS